MNTLSVNHIPGPSRILWQVTAPGNGNRPGLLALKDTLPVMSDIADSFSPPPRLILAGHPGHRHDFDLLLWSAVRRGLSVIVAPDPSATGISAAKVEDWQFTGVDGLEVRIDSPVAKPSRAEQFANAMLQADTATHLGLALHVTTTITRAGVPGLERLGDLVRVLGATEWLLDFDSPETDLSAPEAEEVLTWLSTWAREAPCRVTVYGAPQWVRILDWAGVHWPGAVVRDGHELCFIDAFGHVYPGPRMRVLAGNLHRRAFSRIYLDAPVFEAIRDTSRLEGRCGVCGYTELCGGSRARALRMTGRITADDPGCLRPPDYSGIA